MSLNSGTAMVTMHSLCSLQVCVPKTFTDEEIETFANMQYPTGIESRWKIRRGELGNPEYKTYVQCESLTEHHHVMLDC